MGLDTEDDLDALADVDSQADMDSMDVMSLESLLGAVQSREELARNPGDVIGNEAIDASAELEAQNAINADIADLKALDKRGRESGRDRNRGHDRNRQTGRFRDGSRRKNKDKNNRKGKGNKGRGNKGKTTNKYDVNVYGTQDDMPLNDVYVKEGKIGKDKASLENEIQTISRHMTCFDLHCEGGGRCIPDEMRAGGGVRCQCPLGRQGVYCEQGK